MAYNDSYKDKLASNTMWNAGERYSILGIQLISTFVLSRFLTPADFGLVGMLIVFTAIAQTILDSGFAQALIREKEIEDSDYSTIFYFNIVLSIVLYCILFCCSELIADFYRQPILNDICKLTFLVIPFNALCIVQNTILVRNLQFKKLCLISLASAILSSIITIVFGYLYRNVWALVFQNLLIYVFRSLLLWITTNWHPRLQFSFKRLKYFFTFSKNLLFSGLIGNLFNNIHSILIGRFYTATELGFYSQADRLKNVATNSSTQVIQTVTYPILSQINNNNEDVKDAYKKIICTSLIFVGGIMGLLMSVSIDLFQFLMGSEEWRQSGVYLLILGISGILHPLHSINQNILLVKGRSDSLLILEIIRRTIMIITLIVTVNFNMIIFVSGLSFYSILLLFLNLYYCGRPIQYSLKEQLYDTIPIIIRLLLAVSCCYCVYFLLPDLYFCIRLVIVFAIYLITMFCLFYHNKYLQEVICLIKKRF